MLVEEPGSGVSQEFAGLAAGRRYQIGRQEAAVEEPGDRFGRPGTRLCVEQRDLEACPSFSAWVADRREQRALLQAFGAREQVLSDGDPHAPSARWAAERARPPTVELKLE